MQQATERNKKLAHLVEILPTLKVYMAGDQPVATLKYKDVVVETKINDKAFNSAEVDYHAAICDKLLGKLCQALSLDVSDCKEDPWDPSWGKLKKVVYPEMGQSAGAAAPIHVREGEELEKPEPSKAAPQAEEVAELDELGEEQVIAEAEADACEEILSGNAKDVAAYVKSLDDKDLLYSLKSAEEAGKARKTVADAIDDRLLELDEVGENEEDLQG